jgi:hypothetical protein
VQVEYGAAANSNNVDINQAKVLKLLNLNLNQQSYILNCSEIQRHIAGTVTSHVSTILGFCICNLYPLVVVIPWKHHHVLEGHASILPRHTRALSIKVWRTFCLADQGG